jgi:voltage-gated potassium channel
VRRSQYIRAWLHYLRKPTLQFLPILGGVIVLVLLGGFAFTRLYEHELTYGRAVYMVYTLLFGESVSPAPGHWFLDVICFVTPLLGLVVILDGVVRFSYHILRRDETSREWVQAMGKTMHDHVILFGLGKVGVRILQQLIRIGEAVIVLERNADSPNLAYARKHGIPVRVGNGREEGVLEELNCSEAKSLICVTDDDLANIELALDARKIRPGIRVVLRMFDQELASKIRDSFGLGLAFSTAELAAPLFATASADPSIVNAFYVDGKLIVVANIRVGEGCGLCGKSIRELAKELPLFILNHARGDKHTLYPEGGLVFEAGDQLTLQTEPQTLKRVHDLNGGKPSATKVLART